MTSHLDSHTTTDVKPEMIPGVQTGNGIPHDKYNIHGIANVYKKQTKTYLCKDNCKLTKHTRRWTYSALRYFFLVLEFCCKQLDFEFQSTNFINIVGLGLGLSLTLKSLSKTHYCNPVKLTLFLTSTIT